MISLESINPDLFSDLAKILMISLESTSPDLLSDLAKILKFPMGFQHCSLTSQSVPQHVPNSTSLYLIPFALSSTLVTYIGGPEGGTYNISLLGLSKALLIFIFIFL
jgi:hypothetical protein